MTSPALTPLQISAQVTAAEQLIVACRQKRQEAIRAAEVAYNTETSDSCKMLGQLLEKYKDSAMDLAEAASKCPRHPWGRLMDPTDTAVRDEGVLLSWDIDDNFTPATFLATWEELLATELELSGEPG